MRGALLNTMTNQPSSALSPFHCVSSIEEEEEVIGEWGSSAARAITHAARCAACLAPTTKGLAQLSRSEQNELLHGGPSRCIAYIFPTKRNDERCA